MSATPTVQANEPNFGLHTLGWKAFQNLCSAVTSDLWGQQVQTFLDSHDGGRDGAFRGTWKTKSGEAYSGTFVVQCKFTSNPEKVIRVADLQDELKKASRLAAKGLSANYFLFTNARLSGSNAEAIEAAFRSVQGINAFAAFGAERITQFIRESPRLRMLVPRVYGLAGRQIRGVQVAGHAAGDHSGGAGAQGGVDRSRKRRHTHTAPHRAADGSTLCLRRLSAGIPRPRCSFWIIARVRPRLRLSTS